MTSDASLAALRVAATMTHTLGALRCRIRVGERTWFEVGRHTDPPPGTLSLSPCALRNAVARAHRSAQAGAPTRLLGLPAACDPAVELGVPPCGASFPGGILRVPDPEGWTYAFGTLLPAQRGHDVGRDLVDAAAHPEGLSALGLRGDPETEVTVAYARLDRGAGDGGPADDGEAWVVDLLQALLARFTTTELLDDVAAGASPRGGS